MAHTLRFDPRYGLVTFDDGARFGFIAWSSIRAAHAHLVSGKSFYTCPVAINREQAAFILANFEE